MMNLRDYQHNAIEAVEKHFAKGLNKPVIVLATGTGKTVIFSEVINQRHKQYPHKKALVLAHREELLTQAKDKILKTNPELHVSIEMADQYADDVSDVIVASVATLGRANSKRLERFDPSDFHTVIIDEAHHASATTYQNILAYFGILKVENIPNDDDWVDSDKNTDWNTDCLLLGVTATPSRMDNQGIDKIFDDVVYNYGIIDGVRDGWLSRIRAYRVDTKTSLEEVHTLGGDFKQDELADAINNPERNDLVVKTYLDKFKNKQALVFAIDINHAGALYQAFVDKQVATAIVTGSTDKETRRLILEEFHTKDIQVVVNCMVLTEGYDNDTIDVIMMARPTKSGILYSQMVGRGTRTHHEKPYLTICDFVDNTYRHTIKTSASLIGVEGMVNFQGRDIIEGLEEIDKIREIAPDYNLDKLDFARLEYIMEEVDVMGGLDIPNILKDITTNSWLRYGENGYRISIGNNIYFTVEQSITGQWKAYQDRWDAVDKKAYRTELGEEGGLMALDNIIKRVDRYILNKYPDSLKLVNMDARWRKDPISDAQRNALVRLGVAIEIINQLDKGRASQLQNKLYSRKKR